MFFLTLMIVNFLLAPIEGSLDNQQLKATDSTVTRIYLVRHGESAFNQSPANGVKFTSGKSLSLPLTKNGENQAIQLGKKLIGKFAKNDPLVLVSSTALRAQDTANLLFNELKSYYSIEQGKSEENLLELGQGIWEGKPKDAQYDKAMKIWEDLSAKDKFIFPKISTGESYCEVATRFLASLQEIIARYPHKTIFITTHYTAMNALALQLSDSIFALSDEPATPLPTIHLNNGDMLLIELPVGKRVEQAKVKMHIKSEL